MGKWINKTYIFAVLLTTLSACSPEFRSTQSSGLPADTDDATEMPTDRLVMFFEVENDGDQKSFYIEGALKNIDFGDGSEIQETAADQTVSHTFENAGTYMVTAENSTEGNNECYYLESNEQNLVSISGLQNLPGLQTLNLISESQLQEIDWASLPEGLTSLQLAYTGISAVDWDALPNSIQTIALQGNPITTVTSASLPSSLQGLYLSENSIVEFDVETLPENLFEISIANNLLEEINLNYESCDQVSVLTLYNNHLNATQVENILATIRDLDCENGELDFEDQAETVELSKSGFQDYNYLKQNLDISVDLPTARFTFETTSPNVPVQLYCNNGQFAYVDFGDGTVMNQNGTNHGTSFGQTWYQYTHTYVSAGTYEVKVKDHWSNPCVRINADFGNLKSVSKLYALASLQSWSVNAPLTSFDATELPEGMTFFHLDEAYLSEIKLSSLPESLTEFRIGSNYVPLNIVLGEWPANINEIDLNSSNLSAATVNAFLNHLVNYDSIGSLQGLVDMTGNAAPTGQGLVDKGILINTHGVDLQTE